MKQLVSRRKAQILAFIPFLLGIVLLIYLGKWWPSFLLVLGIPLAFREYLLGRKYDMFITLFVFLGIYITIQFDVGEKFFLPVLFTVGGIYIFFREFFGGTSITEAEEEEDLNKEIEEDKKKKP